MHRRAVKVDLRLTSSCISISKMACCRNTLIRKLLVCSVVALLVLVSSPWSFGNSAPAPDVADAGAAAGDGVADAGTAALDDVADTASAAREDVSDVGASVQDVERENADPSTADAQDERENAEVQDVERENADPSTADAQDERENADAPTADEHDENADAPRAAEQEGEAEDVMNPLQIEVDCETAPVFPSEVFASQSDVTKVYFQPSDLPESIFTKMGFGQFVTIFGIPIVASKDLSPEVLNHAAHIFAEYLDNDEDGIVDLPEALEGMRQYRTIIGYVGGPEESDTLWTERFRAEENEAFRTQFVCNMHFFEQWASDATPGFHNVSDVALSNPDDDEIFCVERSQSEFDWPLWYFPFTASYYGYLETFDNATIDKIESTMKKAQDAGLFTGSYPDDHDMELSDFFVWSMITRLGALRCHCNSEVVLEAWKVCRLEQLEEFDASWVDVLGSLEGLPKRLPDGAYDSAAIVAV